MEAIDNLLEKRQEYSQELENAQSDWFKEMIEEMIFNIDLKLKQLTDN